MRTDSMFRGNGKQTWVTNYTRAFLSPCYTTYHENKQLKKRL